MHSYADSNLKPDYDAEIQEIADYMLVKPINSTLAYDTARLCLIDALGCAMLALNFPECTKLLGPVVPNALLPGGARVPGTNYELDPVQAAFNIGTLIRWLDFNDTWLAAEWGHPSDNIGAILAIADYVSRQNLREGKPSLKMFDVFTMIIKAYEIQGCLALENSFNRLGLDHVFLVKLASAAVAAQLLGANKESMLRTLSQVFIDGQSLRTYRHAPNTGSRKSWAAGDATARAVRLALITAKGEMGYPSALSVPKWGFYDVSYEGKPLKLSRAYESYIVENVLFKLVYPAEFHAQTAVECAIVLHPEIKDKIEDIASIELETQEPAIRIISKEGALYNPADRDHCLQYMAAIGLLYGDLQAQHYEDEIASNPCIDQLRAKMKVIENPKFTRDYYNPKKRAISNSIKVNFKNGSSSALVRIDYPIGHQRRRNEGIPLLYAKFRRNLATRFSTAKVESIVNLMLNNSLGDMSVVDFMAHWVA